MFKLCVGGVIDKTRWIVPYEGHIFEVDEFHGINDGLLFAEVELKTEDEHFEKPLFLGPEVTGNRHFYNSHLLVNPYPQVAQKMLEFQQQELPFYQQFTCLLQTLSLTSFFIYKAQV